MEIKDKVDIIGKEIDILHKKILILLGGVAGSWFYGVEFAQNGILIVQIVGYSFFIAFALFLIGLTVNYLRLNRISEELKELRDGG
jgi:hypothetical protein